MKRRVLLERLGAATAAGALAGCLDETTDGPGSGGDGEDGGENETDGADDGGNGDEENETDERENETSDQNETNENGTADGNETEGSENDTAEENDTEDGGNDGDDGSEEEAGEDEGSDARISDEEITTRNADCGEGNEASIAFADDAVEIEGSLMASDPCHEAVLVDVSVGDDELEATVGTEPVDEGMCAQCIARVDYEATVRFESASPSIVAVRHEGDDGTEEVARERRDE